MSISSQTAARCCKRAFRQSSYSLRLSSTYLSQRTRASPTAMGARRWNSSESISGTPSNPKIAQIVDQISQLTLLETADLVSSLKSRLNIPDLPVGGFAAAPGPGVATPAPVEEEEAPPVQEKTLFNLKLESFEASAKAKVIKEIKSLLGLSLVDSKKFVESAPKMIKESVPKEEAEKIVATMKALGAVAVME